VYHHTALKVRLFHQGTFKVCGTVALALVLEVGAGAPEHADNVPEGRLEVRLGVALTKHPPWVPVYHVAR
jgi:hypothetical protein